MVMRTSTLDDEPYERTHTHEPECPAQSRYRQRHQSLPVALTTAQPPVRTAPPPESMSQAERASAESTRPEVGWRSLRTDTDGTGLIAAGVLGGWLERPWRRVGAEPQLPPTSELWWPRAGLAMRRTGPASELEWRWREPGLRRGPSEFDSMVTARC